MRSLCDITVFLVPVQALQTFTPALLEIGFQSEYSQRRTLKSNEDDYRTVMEI